MPVLHKLYTLCQLNLERLKIVLCFVLNFLDFSHSQTKLRSLGHMSKVIAAKPRRLRDLMNKMACLQQKPLLHCLWEDCKFASLTHRIKGLEITGDFYAAWELEHGPGLVFFDGL